MLVCDGYNAANASTWKAGRVDATDELFTKVRLRGDIGLTLTLTLTLALTLPLTLSHQGAAREASRLPDPRDDHRPGQG